MENIVLALDADNELAVKQFQTRVFGQDQLAFENRVGQAVVLAFSTNHPLPFPRESIELPPGEKVAFKLIDEIHFNYLVSVDKTDPRPRPRSAIITVLQPVEDPPGDPSPVARRKKPLPASIVLSENKQQILIDAPVTHAESGVELVLINQTGETLIFAFQIAAPFAFGQEKIRIEAQEKINRSIDARLRFDFEVTSDKGSLAAAKGTLFLITS